MANRGLAFWSAAMIGPTEVDPAALALMMGHPRFEDACRLMVAKMFARTRRNSVFMRATRDINRYFIGYFALYLHARGGLTLSTIRDLCAQGLASPGRAAAILIRLRMIDYVRPDTAQKDRRVRRYVPTEEMTAAFREAGRDDLEALALLEPEAASAAERLCEPAFFRSYILKAGEGLVEIAKVGGDHVMSFFNTRDAGMMMLLDIASSGEPGDSYPPRGRVKMSVRELARAHEVSRSHVLKLLRDAEKAGLLTRDPDAQSGVLSEKLRTGLVELHVTQLIGQAVCAHAAMVATDTAPTR